MQHQARDGGVIVVDDHDDDGDDGEGSDGYGCGREIAAKRIQYTLLCSYYADYGVDRQTAIT